MNSRKKVISNLNKSKRSTEELSTNKKEPSSKKLLIFTDKLMPRMPKPTETTNSQNSIHLPMPL